MAVVDIPPMDNKLLADQIIDAVRARLGKNEPAVEKLIAEEVAQLLVGQASHPLTATAAAGAPSGPTSTAAAVSGAAVPGTAADAGALTDRIVISANGRNRGGVVAGLTAVISDLQGDIRDITQTIVGDYFTMIIVVDVAGATQKGARFAELKSRLEATGRALGTHVVALHDDLLTAMHTV